MSAKDGGVVAWLLAVGMEGLGEGGHGLGEGSRGEVGADY